MKYLLTVCCILFIGSKGFSQETPEALIDSFFKIYIIEGPDKAVDFVFKTNKWMQQSGDIITSIKSRLTKAVSMLGPYHGYELYAKKQLANSYVSLSYMVKYDRQPIQFSFILYRPQNKWQIQNIRFDDNLDDDLEDKSDIVK